MQGKFVFQYLYFNGNTTIDGKNVYIAKSLVINGWSKKATLG